MDQKKRVLIIGAGREQVPAIVKAREMGFEVLATDLNPEAPGFAEADHSFVVSTGDVEGNCAIAQENAIDGVMTLISETAVPVVAEVAKRMGLPGLSANTVSWATDKIAMRRRFESQEVPQPLFAVINGAENAEKMAEGVGYPLVMKPSVNSGQRGVSMVQSPSQLLAAFEEARSHAPDGIVLIEQFIKGREINVTALVIAGEIHILSLSDRKIYPEPAFGVAYAHHFPARLNREEEEMVLSCANEAITALKMEDGIVYPQIIVNPEGAFLVEIAARIPGGNMREVALYASGFDLIEAAILQSVGLLGSMKELRCHQRFPALCVRFLTTNDTNLPVGLVTSVTGGDEANGEAGVMKAECFLRPGDRVEPVKYSTHRYASIICVGEDVQEASDRAEEVLKKFKIYVNPE